MVSGVLFHMVLRGQGIDGHCNAVNTKSDQAVEVLDQQQAVGGKT